MGVEWIVLVLFFGGFIAWSLMSGSMTKGKNGSVTREPLTLHTESGYQTDREGPAGERASTATSQTAPTDANAQNMP